jgi:ABC-type amino acid transport system permease subunit
MKVRFRFHGARRVTRRRGKNRRLAAAAAALLIPVALMAWVMSLWRIGSDLGVAGEFGFDGLFSHWQVWIALALGVSFAASVLNRYSRGGELDESRVLMPFPNREANPEAPPAVRRKTGSGL